MRDLGSVIKNQEPGKKIDPLEGRSPKSPLAPSGAKASDAFNVNGYTLPLPASKRDLYCAYAEVDPTLCFVSPLNPRLSGLLTIEDPRVAAIANSIEREGQRDPVLARRVVVDGHERHEVIWGKSRHFAILHINRRRQATEGGEQPLKLRVWVGDVPDADVRPLAIGENKDRRELSDYERAIDLAKQREGGYKHLSFERISAMEGISKTEVGRLVTMAKLPAWVVGLMASPQDLGSSAGEAAAQHYEQAVASGMDAEAQAQEREALASQPPFDKSLRLVKVVERLSQKYVGKTPKKLKQKSFVNAQSGELALKVTRHRTEKRQFKLDLFDVDEGEVKEIVDYIQRKKNLAEKK